MKYLYMRASTNETKQSLQRQEKFGRDNNIPESNWFKEFASGANNDRVELNRLLSVVKENDEQNLNNIRTLFRLNINYCKMLLILTLNFFSKKDDMTDIYDLYAIVFLLDINLVDSIDNLKSLLNKYDEYLYLNITRKYFNNNKNESKFKEIKSQIKELNDEENLNEKIVGIMKEILTKFSVS